MVTTAVTPPRYREYDGDKAVINPHAGQMRVLDSRARFVVFMAGTQVGKTCLGPDWLHREIRDKGPGDYLAVTATYPLLELKMLPEFLELFENRMKLGKFRGDDRIFTFSEYGEKAMFGSEQDIPTRIIFGSAVNPESLESATAKAAWLDEAGQKQFRRNTWEAVNRRLSLAEGRCLITTTPYGLGWLKTELYDPWVAGDKSIEVIQVASIANPLFPVQEFERMRARLPTWKFDMMYRGLFTRPPGLIYDCFDDENDLVSMKNPPLGWPVFVAHDFGPDNTAALFYAQDTVSGLFYLFAEYRRAKLTIGEHVANFREITKGRPVVMRVGGAWGEEQTREGFTGAGWPIIKSKTKNVEPGILLTYAYHKYHLIKVCPGMYGYIDEITSYSRTIDENNVVGDDIDNQSAYHYMDCERYLFSHLDLIDAEGDDEYAPVGRTR